jgi:hypothetical protein
MWASPSAGRAPANVSRARRWNASSQPPTRTFLSTKTGSADASIRTIARAGHRIAIRPATPRRDTLAFGTPHAKAVSVSEAGRGVPCAAPATTATRRARRVRYATQSRAAVRAFQAANPPGGRAPRRPSAPASLPASGVAAWMPSRTVRTVTLARASYVFGRPSASRVIASFRLSWTARSEGHAALAALRESARFSRRPAADLRGLGPVRRTWRARRAPSREKVR